jgi:hypothetical protein
VYGWFFNQ